MQKLPFHYILVLLSVNDQDIVLKAKINGSSKLLFTNMKEPGLNIIYF